MVHPIAKSLPCHPLPLSTPVLFLFHLLLVNPLNSKQVEALIIAMAAEAKIPASLEQESAVTRLDDKTFAANLSPSFCIGAGMYSQRIEPPLLIHHSLPIKSDISFDSQFKANAE